MILEFFASFAIILSIESILRTWEGTITVAKADNPGKSKWPYAILAVMVVFTIAFVTIAVLASLRSRNLVSQSYFSDGQQYQTTIDARKRASQLSSPLELRYAQDGNILDISMPPEHRGQDIRGIIRLYRPSGEKLDRTFPLNPDSTGSQRLILDSLPSGAWKVSISWNLGDEEFLVEQNIFVNL